MTDYMRVPEPLFPPSCCRLCSSGHDPAGFVDLGSDLQAVVENAKVYVCSRCSVQLGATFGMLDAPSVAAMRAELAGLRDANAGLRVDVEKAKGRGSWTWVADGLSSVVNDMKGGVAAEPIGNGEGLRDLTICPDCGNSKNATSKRCRDCHTKTLHAPKAEATA